MNVVVKRISFGVVLVAAVFGSWCAIYSYSLFPPLSKAQRKSIKPGMDRDEVLKICGQPDSGISLTDECWNYSSRFSMEFFQVCFDEKGKVTYAILGD